MTTPTPCRLIAASSALLLVAAARAQNVDVSVPGQADPWLAGMPNGSTASSGDVAPAQSPVLVPLALVAGSPITVVASSGLTNYDGTPACAPDGCNYGVFCHGPGAENGISNFCCTRVAALIGVFLDDSLPTSSPAPAGMNFTTPASLDYAVLSPGLKQVFFIGNGRTSGGTVQEVVVPTGATRLFLGISDGVGWYNNPGSFSVTLNQNCPGCNGPSCDPIDFNGDGLFPDTADIDDFLSVFSGGPCSTGTCGDIDFNNDGLFPDTTDIDSLLSVFSGGACL